MKKLIPFAALALLSSCEGLSVADAYLEADRLTYKAIAPKSTAYVEADESLDEGTKKLRIAVLRAWKVRLDENEKK